MGQPHGSCVNTCDMGNRCEGQDPSRPPAGAVTMDARVVEGHSKGTSLGKLLESDAFGNEAPVHIGKSLPSRADIPRTGIGTSDLEQRILDEHEPQTRGTAPERDWGRGDDCTVTTDEEYRPGTVNGGCAAVLACACLGSTADAEGPSSVTHYSAEALSEQFSATPAAAARRQAATGAEATDKSGLAFEQVRSPDTQEETLEGSATGQHPGAIPCDEAAGGPKLEGPASRPGVSGASSSSSFEQPKEPAESPEPPPLRGILAATRASGFLEWHAQVSPMSANNDANLMESRREPGFMESGKHESNWESHAAGFMDSTGSGYHEPIVLSPSEREERDAEFREKLPRLLAKLDPETEHKAAVEAFLKANGFNHILEKRRRGLDTTYPLHVATEQGLVRMVGLLLEARADANLKNTWGRTALDIAKKSSLKSAGPGAKAEALCGAFAPKDVPGAAAAGG